MTREARLMRQNFFRAGHAHARVIVILSLVCQILADSAVLPLVLSGLCVLECPSRRFSYRLGSFFRCCRPRLPRLVAKSV
jgi:hypothetical protein